jgi:hypothetical protein
MEETSLVGVGRREGLWRDDEGVLEEDEEDAGWGRGWERERGRGSGVGVGVDCEEEGTGPCCDWASVLVCELGSTRASSWAWAWAWAGNGPGARVVGVEDGRDGGTGADFGVGRSWIVRFPTRSSMSDAGLDFGLGFGLGTVASNGFATLATPLDVPDCGGDCISTPRPELSLSSCGADAGVLAEGIFVPTNGTSTPDRPDGPRGRVRS